MVLTLGKFDDTICKSIYFSVFQMDSELKNIFQNEIRKAEREKTYYAEKIRQDKLQIKHDTEEFIEQERRLSKLQDDRKKLGRL